MKSLPKFVGMFLLASFVAGVIALAPARAEDKKPATEAKAKTSTVKQELMFWIEDAESKLTQLAEATPEEKYAWRPAEGVRTTGEVFLHVCAANYGIGAFWGVAPPEGFKFEGYEQSITKKADVVAAIKDSYAHMKKGLTNATDADFDKQVKLFGGMDMTERSAYMLLMMHGHEHLGQSIAYARMNGITPPWTAKEMAEAEAKKAAESTKQAESK